MSSGGIIILCIIGIVISIAIGYKWGVNTGVVAMVCAYIIGCFFMNMRVREVILLWPIRTYFQVMSITLFFGFGVVNGTMQIVANKVVYACRERRWMLTFALFAVGILLGVIGCSPPVAGAILAVMMFTVAVPAGLNPLIACFIMNANNFGSFVLWGASGTIINPNIAANGYEAQSVGWTWASFGLSVVFSLVLTIVLFFIYKGYKINAISFDKPEPFTSVQKKNLIIILIVVLLAVIPSVLNQFFGGPTLKKLAEVADIQMLSMIGFIVCSLMKIADGRAVIKAVPWNTLLLIGGISTLMAVAGEAGVVKMLTEWLSSSVAAILLPALLCLLAGFLSCFSGGITVVFPMLAPMVYGLAQGSGVSPLLMFLAILLGASFTAVSPFSTGGAVFLANCRDENMARKLVVGQLGMAAYGLVASVILVTIVAVL